MADSASSSTLGAALADLLAPPSCMLCSRAGVHLCHGCASLLLEPPALPPPVGLDSLVVLCTYEELGRDLVLSLKRRNRRGALPLLGAALADAVECAASPVTSAGPEVVTWAPTTSRRARGRGFDQSQLLAQQVGPVLALPCRRLLRRNSAEVMGANRRQRLGGVAFSAATLPAATVLVVDDVVTTGATMSAAASALRSAGADSVTGVALARAGPGEAPSSAQP